MYTLSLVMKSIPVGVTYASFAGLCIIATIVVGIIKFNQRIQYIISIYYGVDNIASAIVNTIVFAVFFLSGWSAHLEPHMSDMWAKMLVVRTFAPFWVRKSVF